MPEEKGLSTEDANTKAAKAIDEDAKKVTLVVEDRANQKWTLIIETDG